MEFKDLLAKSIAEERAEPEDKLPAWVSADNASLAAYEAINSFKKKKFAYIRKHKTATAFRIAKNFQVQKKEVADKIGATTQAIFYASSYSEKLRFYLEGKDDKGEDGVNYELMKRKEERIAKPRTGLASKTKTVVLATAQSGRNRIKELEKQNAADQLTLAIAKLPHNVRIKLKLT